MNTMVYNTRIWFLARYISFKDTFNLVFKGADTVTIRLLLAWGSIASGINLMLDDDKFAAPVYKVVATYGDERMWMAYFFIHALGVHWRIFDRAHARPNWALAINLWGFTIWFVSVFGVSWSAGNLGLNTSLALIMVVASGWSLYRTGFGRDVVSP
jgi:hypothetical protein